MKPLKHAMTGLVLLTKKAAKQISTVLALVY